MLLSLDAQPDKRGQISPAAIERTVNKQCELSNTRRYARALRTRLTPAPSELKSSREPRTENGARRTVANVWLASLCCCLLANKLVLHAEYLPLCMCVCACVCQWLFARGFVGSRHCLLALFQLGEVHVVAIVRIQVRNSSPLSDSAWHSCKTHKSAHSVLSARQRLLYSYYVPCTPCPSTECGIVCKVRSIFKHVCKELCSDSLLKRTR